uniref:Transmembrane protein 176 n=1 Tax=Paramormyrops kingsleyae TaxID=1676925 RepID=A0A3B3T0M3_9TELE
MDVTVSRNLSVTVTDHSADKLRERQQKLRDRLQKVESKVLGVSQVMLGVMVISYSLPLHLTEYTEVMTFGVPWWSAIVFIVAGAVAIETGKLASMNSLRVCLLVTLVAVLTSTLALIFYSIDLHNNQDTDCAINSSAAPCGPQHYAKVGSFPVSVPSLHHVCNASALCLRHVCTASALYVCTSSALCCAISTSSCSSLSLHNMSALHCAVSVLAALSALCLHMSLSCFAVSLDNASALHCVVSVLSALSAWCLGMSSSTSYSSLSLDNMSVLLCAVSVLSALSALCLCMSFSCFVVSLDNASVLHCVVSVLLLLLLLLLFSLSGKCQLLFPAGPHTVLLSA